MIEFDYASRAVPCREAKYVCDDTSEEWLAARKGVMTASGIPVIMGLNPYQTREDLLATKIHGDDFGGNASTWWGQRMEAPVATATGIALGFNTVNLNRFYVREDLKLGATIDGYIWYDPELAFAGDNMALRGPRTDAKGKNLTDDQLYDKSWAGDLKQCVMAHEKPMLLEVKTTAEYVGRKYGYRECPELYYAQVQGQMLVTGFDACLVACLVGGRDLKCWMVEADDDFQQAIVLETHRFMNELKELSNV